MLHRVQLYKPIAGSQARQRIVCPVAHANPQPVRRRCRLFEKLPEPSVQICSASMWAGAFLAEWAGDRAHEAPSLSSQLLGRFGSGVSWSCFLCVAHLVQW